VPNEGVRLALENTISSTDWTPVIEAIDKSERLLKLTWAKEADEKKYQKSLEAYKGNLLLVGIKTDMAQWLCLVLSPIQI
jgi:hypothetical protein